MTTNAAMLAYHNSNLENLPDHWAGDRDEPERWKDVDTDGELGISLDARLNQMKESDLYKKVGEPVDDKYNGDDTTQELTEVERGKDAENDEDKFWAKEIEKRQEDARRAVMKWRENGAIS